MILPLPRMDLDQIGGNALLEVLASLLELPATGIARDSDVPAEARDPRIVATVPLAGDGISGEVRLEFPEPFARHAEGLLLGPDATSHSTALQLRDLTGEVANMIAGRVAASLTQQGHPCSLGVPSVTHTEGVHPVPATGELHTRTLWSCAGHPIALEVHCQPRPT